MTIERRSMARRRVKVAVVTTGNLTTVLVRTPNGDWYNVDDDGTAWLCDPVEFYDSLSTDATVDDPETLQHWRECAEAIRSVS